MCFVSPDEAPADRSELSKASLFMDKYRNPPLRQNDFAVVLCTLDFPKGIRETIDSILASTPAPTLLIIVDQSHPSSTTPLQDFDSHPDVLRIKLPESGLSWARNVGTAAAMTKGFRFVAYTDDDCTVTSNWLSGFASSFASDPDVAMVFGSTLAAPHDPKLGTIPAYDVLTERIYRGMKSKHLSEGMGACMALRIDAWHQLGGFDDQLGAGSPLRSGEENDMSVRLLHSQYAIAETPHAKVVHYGFRDRLLSPQLHASYMLGSGAATAKMIRIGKLTAIRTILGMSKRWLMGKPGISIGHLPSRRTRLWFFLKGLSEGWKLSIDPRTKRFLPFKHTEEAAFASASQRALSTAVHR
jgi:GT2 family glycosyltransferase